MKRRWIAAAVVLAAPATLISYKEATQPDAFVQQEPTPARESPMVVLVADPREAESNCGCGEIIRMVRSAGDKGVAVLEVPPGSKESREYRATVNPTVLFIDPSGAVVTRYEGEAPEAISEIHGRLQELVRR